MSHLTNVAPRSLGFRLGWTFTEARDEVLYRDRKAVRGLPFPVVGPLPTRGGHTEPVEKTPVLRGPWLYLWTEGDDTIRYVGQHKERSVFYRMIRPDEKTGSPHWTHGTESATKTPTITHAWEVIRAERGPVRLYYLAYPELREILARFGGAEVLAEADPVAVVRDAEAVLIEALAPAWNNGPGRAQGTGVVPTVRAWLQGADAPAV